MLLVIGVIFMLALFGVVCYYIGLRLYPLAALLPGAVRKAFTAVYALLCAALILRFGIMFFSVGEPVKQVIYTVSSCWMGLFVYLLLFFILTDAALGIWKLCRATPIPRLYATAAAVLMALGLTGYGMIHAQSIDTVTYEVQISEKGDMEGLNIVLISDLHLGAVYSEERLESMVAQINALEPDIVCLAGDIFDSDFAAIQNPGKAAETLRKLSATYGVYACLGNHDAGPTFPQMESFLELSRILLLSETAVNVDNRLILLGRVDGSPIGGQGQHKRGNTASLLASLDTGLPVVVIDHNPANLPQYASDADLVLCGHTHHGQIWPGNYFTAYGYYPRSNSRPQYIVTSGVGYWGPPLRVGSSCEIVNITLR